MSPASQKLSYVYLDLVLADNITGICTSQYMIENKYSFTFTSQNSVKIIIFNKGFYKIRKSGIYRWKQFTHWCIE